MSQSNQWPIGRMALALSAMFLLLGWMARLSVSRAREQTHALSSELKALQALRDIRAGEVEQLQLELTTLQERRTHPAEQGSLARRAKITPASVTDPWDNPPAELPFWDESSPYVWIRKNALSTLSIAGIESGGTLNPSIAFVLAIDPATMDFLNQQLANTLETYQSLESEHAARTHAHPPNQSSKDPTVTVQIPPLPEDAVRLKSNFETVLGERLGQQRAGLLMQVASEWMDEQFSAGGTLPKTYSVVRHPDGSHTIFSAQGNITRSWSGLRDFSVFIPPHLLKFFEELSADPKESP